MNDHDYKEKLVLCQQLFESNVWFVMCVCLRLKQIVTFSSNQFSNLV